MTSNFNSIYYLKHESKIILANSSWFLNVLYSLSIEIVAFQVFRIHRTYILFLHPLHLFFQNGLEMKYFSSFLQHINKNSSSNFRIVLFKAKPIRVNHFPLFTIKIIKVLVENVDYVKFLLVHQYSLVRRILSHISSNFHLVQGLMKFVQSTW